MRSLMHDLLIHRRLRAACLLTFKAPASSSLSLSLSCPFPCCSSCFSPPSFPFRNFCFGSLSLFLPVLDVIAHLAPLAAVFSIAFLLVPPNGVLVLICLSFGQSCPVLSWCPLHPLTCCLPPCLNLYSESLNAPAHLCRHRDSSCPRTMSGIHTIVICFPFISSNVG